ncbi:MAG TPA: hypothetical protein VJ302_10305 [Blastocatellia bacterium]|nr:hypothetical protein [Blastocatellia bacterium]
MKSGKRPKPKRRPEARAVRGGTARLTRAEPASGPAPPAPVKTSAPAANGSRTAPPDAENWQMPEALIEAGGAGGRGLKPGRFMMIVTVLSIVFIAIMTWFVSQMPAR